jgi:hypothetical protein
LDWHEELNASAVNASAIVAHNRKREHLIAKLQAQFRAFWAAGAFARLFHVRKALDQLGRFTRKPIMPPEVLHPIIDRRIARKWGVTDRKVRRCRSNWERKLMPYPVWQEREFVVRGRLDHAARQRAKELMTEARYDKREPVRLAKSGLLVASEPLLAGNPLYLKQQGRFPHDGTPSRAESTFNRLTDQRWVDWPIGLKRRRPAKELVKAARRRKG